MHTNSTRLWDYLSIVLILICLWIPAALLQSTGWAADLDQVELLALLGGVAGLILGRSSLKNYESHSIFLLLSIILPFGLFTFRMTPDVEFILRFGILAQRVSLAFGQVIAHRVVQDSIIFVIFCCYFFWLVGYLSGYGLSRKWNPWQGLLMAAGIFGVIDFYSGSPNGAKWSGAALIFCLLLLAARLFWVYQKKAWDEKGFMVERDAGETVFRLAGVVAIVLVLFSWNLQTIILTLTPGTPEHERVSEFWKSVQTNLQNNFAALQSTTSLTGAYPGGMKLGNQAPLSQAPAFQVKILSASSQVPRFYWRVRIYEDYHRGQWQAPEIQNTDSLPLDLKTVSQISAYSRVTAQYIWQEGDGSIIPFYGRLSTLDIPFHLKTSTGTGQVAGDGILFPQTPLGKDRLFILTSAIFNGSGDDLTAVPYSTPSQINEKNLEVPDTIPDRVKNLARQIAVGDTVLQRVQAVTNYLRSGYEYKSQISPVPFGKEPIDWFLFDSKQGFCNYFATAEVLLLRSAGIPARLAVGYSQGEPMGDWFQVRLSNGHAWPEVYFPEYGWVPFEPTPNQPEIAYPIKQQNNRRDVLNELSPEERRSTLGEISPEDQPLDETEDDPRLIRSRWIFAVTLIILAILIVFTIWWISRKQNWKKPPRLSSMILMWLKKHHKPIPVWLAEWDWYSGLPDLAVQYFWLEKIALFSRTIPDLPTTPGELLTELAVRMPDCSPQVKQFHDGLYQQLYSREHSHSIPECKTAGYVLQNRLLKEWRNKIFTRKPRRSRRINR